MSRKVILGQSKHAALVMRNLRVLDYLLVLSFLSKTTYLFEYKKDKTEFGYAMLIVHA